MSELTFRNQEELDDYIIEQAELKMMEAGVFDEKTAEILRKLAPHFTPKLD